MPPWRTFLWVKLIEVLVQARPKALRRTYCSPTGASAAGMRWYARIGRRVWLHEVWSYLFATGAPPKGRASKSSGTCGWSQTRRLCLQHGDARRRCGKGEVERF